MLIAVEGIADLVDHVAGLAWGDGVVGLVGAIGAVFCSGTPPGTAVLTGWESPYPVYQPVRDPFRVLSVPFQVRLQKPIFHPRPPDEEEGHPQRWHTR